MKFFPKPWQIERARNPSHINSAWLAIYMVFANLISLLWAVWIMQPVLYVRAIFVGLFKMLRVVVLATVGTVVGTVRLFFYGVMGGLNANDKTIEDIAREAFERWAEKNGYTPEPADADAADATR